VRQAARPTPSSSRSEASYPPEVIVHLRDLAEGQLGEEQDHATIDRLSNSVHALAMTVWSSDSGSKDRCKCKCILLLEIVTVALQNAKTVQKCIVQFVHPKYILLLKCSPMIEQK
jgi:hypothetical protein